MIVIVVQWHKKLREPLAMQDCLMAGCATSQAAYVHCNIASAACLLLNHQAMKYHGGLRVDKVMQCYPRLEAGAPLVTAYRTKWKLSNCAETSSEHWHAG